MNKKCTGSLFCECPDCFHAVHKAEENIPKVAGSVLIRPTTRGELRDLLSAGKSCEVAETTQEITCHMLRGWLEFDAFVIRPSENDEWVIFEPTKKNVNEKRQK